MAESIFPPPARPVPEALNRRLTPCARMWFDCLMADASAGRARRTATRR